MASRKLNSQETSIGNNQSVYRKTNQSPLKIKSERKEELLEFLSLITIQSWDESAGLEYAKQHTFLKKNGMMIGNMDLLIASHARSIKATLITNNVHKFERVEGLKIENWV